MVTATSSSRNARCQRCIDSVRSTRGGGRGAGLNHVPSGKFNANAAWLVLAALAHNIVRWVARPGLDHHGPIVAKTLRRRLITLPGRITRSARRDLLHLPRRWPWQREFMTAVVRLRSMPLAC